MYYRYFVDSEGTIFAKQDTIGGRMSAAKLQSVKNQLEQSVRQVEMYPDLHKALLSCYRKVSTQLLKVGMEEPSSATLSGIKASLVQVSNRQKQLKVLLKQNQGDLHSTYQREQALNREEIKRLEAARKTIEIKEKRERDRRNKTLSK